MYCVKKYKDEEWGSFVGGLKDTRLNNKDIRDELINREKIERRNYAKRTKITDSNTFRNHK